MKEIKKVIIEAVQDSIDLADNQVSISVLNTLLDQQLPEQLALYGVSGSLFETAKQLIEMYEERITRANRVRNYLDAHNNQISVNVLEHLIAVINHNDR